MLSLEQKTFCFEQKFVLLYHVQSLPNLSTAALNQKQGVRLKQKKKRVTQKMSGDTP
jgi:hypothetical protein